VVSRSGALPAGIPPQERVAIVRTLREAAPAVDAFILATPNGLHAAGAVEAASLGRHVLSEKPVATTIADADEAVSACRAARVTLGVCYQRRMSPDNIAVRRLIRSGALGRILAADMTVKFYREQSYYNSAPYRGSLSMDGGGALMQQGCHQADLYGWFFGRPVSVKSMTATLAHRMETEDHGAAILLHANGMIGTFVASTLARPGFPPRVEIHAEAGSIVMVNDAITEWLVEGVPNPAQPGSADLHSGAGAGGAAVTETAGHEAIIADFVDATRSGRPPAASGEDARLATELILEIYRAARA
jgi:predicted dehydrogenase